MKKYNFGILLLAMLAIVSGVKFFMGSTPVFAAAACAVNSNNTIVYVESGQCWGTHLCTNGVMGDPGSCTSGGAIIVGAGDTLNGTLQPSTKYYFRVKAGNQFGASAWSTAFNFTTGAQSTAATTSSVITPSFGLTSDNIFSLLISNGAKWINGSGSRVSPKVVTTRLNYYDENNTQIYLSGAETTKVGALIESLVLSRGGSTTDGSNLRAFPCSTSVGTFQPGQTFPSGTYTCTCISGSNVSCSAAAVIGSSTANQ